MDTKRMEATITFGMLDIPVGVLPVIDSTEKRVRFTNLHAECLTPLVQPKQCPTCKREVDKTEVVSGYKSGGKFTPILEEEKKIVAAAKSSVIEVTKFLESADMGREFALIRLGVDSNHWLLPEDGLPLKHYAVLWEAMASRDVVGFAKTTLSGKEWPSILSAHPNAGLLLTKVWPSRAVREWDIELPDADHKLVSQTQVLIGEYMDELEEQDLVASSQDDLRDFCEAKASGGGFILQDELPVYEPTIDMQTALRESIAEAKALKTTHKKKSSRKRVTA